ncbi:MAG: hypothetical protein VB050_17690 [Geobacteraceae bacterium]|nr:hypothetical protein [Geobacteraceae bacterium]
MILSFTNIRQYLRQSLNKNRKRQETKGLIKDKIIGICVTIIVFSFFVFHPHYAYSDSNCKISPDNKKRIVWECKNELHKSSIYTRECRIYAVGFGGKKEWIHKGSDLPEPTVKWHNNSLAKVIIPCGSPCSYSIFYDVIKGTSAPYEFVLAVNADKHIIARAGKTYILINSIYDVSREIMKIKRKFSETAALVLVIEEAHFTKKGNLFIRYLSGRNFEPREETIPIKFIYHK